MRRILVGVWGKDASKYVGRSMTLYRDPAVAFGGLAGRRHSRQPHERHHRGQDGRAAGHARRKAPFKIKPLVNMKNKLTDLNNHLFAQLERLSDEDLSGEQIADEVKRADAVVAVADQIVRNADLQLKAVTILANHGARVESAFDHARRSAAAHPCGGANVSWCDQCEARCCAGRGRSLQGCALQGEGRRVKGRRSSTAPRKWRGWKLTA
jgi:hypothetical protein